MHRLPRVAAPLLAAGLLLTACGDDSGSSSDTSAATLAAATTAAPATTAAATTVKPSATTAKATTSTTPAVAGDVTVFAAASLTDAFTEIGDAFMEANPDARVTFSFGGSSALVQQINEGAPADVFASADESNMKKLTDAGNAAADPEPIATNSMEIAVEPGNPKGITGLASLAGSGVKLVLCAAEVPCGKLATQILTNADVTVTPVSLEENVKAVLTKVELGEADAGIVYRTDVAAAGDKVEGVVIPPGQNATTTLLIAPTEESTNVEGADAFVAFVLGADGRKVLEKYGFGAP